MRGILSGALLIAYVGIGAVLYLRAMAARLDRDRPIWAPDLLRPNLFTPEGLVRRRAALRFYMLGALVLGASWWVLAA